MEDTNTTLEGLLSLIEGHQNSPDNALYSNKAHLKNIKLLTITLGRTEDLSSSDAERILKIYLKYKNDMQCVPYLLEMVSNLINFDKVKPFLPEVDFLQSALAIIELLKMLSVESVKVTHIRSLAFQVLSSHPINALSKLIQSHCSKIIEILQLYLNTKQQTMESKADSLALLKLLEVLPPTEKTLFVKEGIRLWLSCVLMNIIEYLVKSESWDKHEEYVNYLENLTEEMVHMEYFEYPEFRDFVLSICDAKGFPFLIKKLFESGKYIWYRIWIVLIKLLQHHTTHYTGSKGTPINSLLPIVEAAFKNDPIQRVRAFKCWTEVINNFSQEQNENCIPKRVKLLLTPLKLNNAKTEEIISAKFDTWWHLIWVYQSRLREFVNEILVPFIQFAFGTSKLPFWACQVSSLKKKCLEAFVEIVGHCDMENCCSTEMPYLNAKIMTLELFINHWNEWFNALKSAIKVASSLNCPAANANLRCVWKSIMMMLAGVPDATWRSEKLNEVVKMLTALVEDCKTDGNLMGLLVESLVRPLFSENILKSLIDTNCQERSSMMNTIVTLIMDKTMDQYYRQLSHEDLMKLLKPIATSLIEKSDQNDTVFLQNLPQNDCTLKLWMAEVENMFEKYEISLLNNLLLWPLQSIGAFSDVKQPASTWYNIFQFASGQLIDFGFHKQLAKILEKQITGSAAIFAICAICGVLKHTNDVELVKKLKELCSQVKGDSFLKECSPEIRTEVQKVISSIEKANHFGNNTINALGSIVMKESPKRALNKKKGPNILKTVVENGEEFVVVKTNWKFNPKKLTVNQKERLQRKREIPALYQDLSQSQDEIKLSAWKTDSQDTSLSSSKSSKAASNNDPSEALKNMSNTDVVPKIMENILTDSNKRKQQTGHNQIQSPVSIKKVQKTDKLLTPKVTKSPRMALKDRVFQNVKFLIEKSSPLSPQNIDKNSQKDRNPIERIVKTPVSTPINASNQLDSNIQEDLITNNATPVNNTDMDSETVNLDKQENCNIMETSKTRVINGTDMVDSDAPSLADRPVREKKTPSKYKNSRLYGIKKRRLSNCYSKPDSKDIQTDLAAKISESQSPKNMNVSEKNKDLTQTSTVIEDVVEAGKINMHKPSIVYIPNEVMMMKHIIDYDILDEKSALVDDNISLQSKKNNMDNTIEKATEKRTSSNIKNTRRRNSRENNANENKVSDNIGVPSNGIKDLGRASEISKSDENDFVLEAIELPLSKRIKDCITKPTTEKNVKSKDVQDKKVESKPKKNTQSKKHIETLTTENKDKTLRIKDCITKPTTEKNVKSKDDQDKKVESKPKINTQSKKHIETLTTENKDETLLKNNDRKARIEKNLMINMVKGHPFLSKETSPKRRKRNRIKTSPNAIVIDEHDERSSSSLYANSLEPCSEDIIESSQDSSLTTISTPSTRSKRTLKFQPVVVLKKIDVENILTQKLQDTSLDIELPQNKTDVHDDSTAPISMNTSNVVGPETQELAEADTQPNPADFMEVDHCPSENHNPITAPTEPNVEINTTANDITQTLVDVIPHSNIDSTNEMSSPFKGDDQRKQDFLNNTLEISPIKIQSPDKRKTSRSPETSNDFVVITLSSPVNSNGEPIDKSPTSPEFFTEDKVSPDKRDDSPPRADTRPNSTSPRLALKKNRTPLRSGGRAAQMIGMLGTTLNKKQESEETKNGSSTPARRNLRILYNSVGKDTDNSSESTGDFLQFTRPLPTVASSPSGPILKKRKLDEIIDETSVSPASKIKRVSFQDPPVSTTVSVHKYIESISGVRSPQSSAVHRQLRSSRSPKDLSKIFKSHDLDSLLSKTVESFNDTAQMSTDDTQSTSLDVTPAVEIVKTCELNDTDPVFPDLIDCKDPIEAISTDLSSPAMNELFVQELKGKVETVGDLAKMTELEVNRLCIKAPKIKVTKKVLEEYGAKIAANKLVETVIEEAFSEPLTESLLRTASVEVEIQTNEVEVNHAEIQTDVEPVSLAFTQTETVLTTERDVQTDESGSKTTSDMISCLFEREDFAVEFTDKLNKLPTASHSNSPTEKCDDQKEDFVKKLSDKLNEKLKLKIANNLSTASHVDLILSKFDDSTSFDHHQKEDFVMKLSDKLNKKLKVKIANKLSTASLVDLIMAKYEDSASFNQSQKEDFVMKLSDKLDNELKLKIAKKLPAASQIDLILSKYDDSASFDNDQREHFVMKLSDKLDEKLKVKIANKLPASSHVDLIMAKYEDSASIGHNQKEDFVMKLSNKLDNELKLKIANELPTASLIDLLMKKCDNSTSNALLSTLLDKQIESSSSDVDLDCALKMHLLNGQYLNNLKVAETKKRQHVSTTIFDS